MPYVIRNCPAYQTFYSDTTNGSSSTLCTKGFTKAYCQDCTDCVMKQIVELCAEEYHKCKHCKKECDDKCSQASGFDLTLKIRQLLDVQEVE